MNTTTEQINKLTLGSLFDGSGGFPLGGLLSGVTPLWASEIEPFPVRVTTKRIPDMKHYGDISTMNGGEIEPVDIITFGSPCQDMSVAGKRSGLDGERSCLFYEAIRIVKEMRYKTNGKKPRYIVWENVPGAFSSNKGADFKAVLESICKVKDETISIPKSDKWQPSGEIVGTDFSLAWRVLDAQYWGVPQRRKRIYLVADFTGTSAGKILFESEGLSRYSAEGFRAWQRVTGSVADCIGTTGFTDDVTATLRAEAHQPPCVMESAGFCTEHSAKSRGIGYEVGKSPTLRAGVIPATVYENHGQGSRYTGPLEVAPTTVAAYGMGGNNQPFVVEPTVFDVYHRGIYKADTSRTLDCDGGNPTCNQGGITIVEGNGSRGGTDVVYAIDRETFNCGQNYARNLGITEDGVNSTLNAQGPSAVATPSYSMTTGSFMQINEEKSPTLIARDFKDPPCVNGVGYTVRRLTPTECARLQGFPDWWCADLGIDNPTEEDICFWSEVWETHRKIIGKSSKPKTRKQIIKWLKKPHSDTAEYKMWGNGVALPCVYFVLSGIVFSTQDEECEVEETK